MFEYCCCSEIVLNTSRNPLTYLGFLILSPLNGVARFSNFPCTYVTIVLLMSTQIWGLKPPKPRDVEIWCLSQQMTAKVIATPNAVQTSGS